MSLAYLRARYPAAFAALQHSAAVFGPPPNSNNASNMNAAEAITALDHASMPNPETPWCNRHPRAKPIASNRNVAWYRRERAKWIIHLGGKCAHCGATEQLEFDHDVPRSWQPNRTSRWQRLRNYIKEIKEGKIKQLLCRSCNAVKGYPDGQRELLERAAPPTRPQDPF